LATRLIRDIADGVKVNRVSALVGESDYPALALFRKSDFRIVCKKQSMGLSYFRLAWHRHTPPVQCYESRFGKL
jgi:hypothetical protein